MDKLFNNIKINRPSFFRDCVIIDCETDVEKILNNLYWSENSNDPSIEIQNDVIKINKKKFFFGLDLKKLEANRIYYLIGGGKNGTPIRFTYDNISSELPFESHFQVDESYGLETDIFINQWGNIGIQRRAKHILDSYTKRLPLQLEINDVEVSTNDIRIIIEIQFDKYRFDLTSTEIRPIYIEVRNDRTEISRIHNFLVEFKDNKVIIKIKIEKLINLKENVNYSFGVIIKSGATKYIHIVNRVTYEVFKKIYPLSNNSFLFNNAIVNFSWFDNEGIIIRKELSERIEDKEKLKFEEKYNFKEIISQEGKKQIDEKFAIFLNHWIEESSYRNF